MDKIRFHVGRDEIDLDALAATFFKASQKEGHSSADQNVALMAALLVTFVAALATSSTLVLVLALPLIAIVGLRLLIGRSQRGFPDKLRAQPDFTETYTLELRSDGIGIELETARVWQSWLRYLEARSVDDHLVLVQPNKQFRVFPWSGLQDGCDPADALQLINGWIRASTEKPAVAG